LAAEVRMLLGEVGKLREERRNIQLSVVTVSSWVGPVTYQRNFFLVKLALFCLYEASTKPAACLIQIGESIVLLQSLLDLPAQFIIGNQAHFPSGRNHQLTYHPTSPRLLPNLDRVDGVPFPSVVDSGAFVKSLSLPQRDLSSKQCHHQRRRLIVRRPPARGQPGKVNAPILSAVGGA